MSNHDTTDTRALFEQFVIPTYGRFDLRIARGSGAELWDESGRRYLDFGTGIAVASVGHCHPHVTAAIQQQAAQLVHASNLYHARPQGELARRLTGLVGRPGKIFFCNSGAEANEALYKLARKFGNECRPPAPRHRAGEVVTPAVDRHVVLTAMDSFHGRTLAGIAATAQEKVRKGFDPLTPGFDHVPFDDGPVLQEAVQRPGVVALLIEPVQGERGVFPASADYLRLAQNLCAQHDLLFMVDEVQCGMGRTGEWCGWRTIAPSVRVDAISWAKGLAGGFPMGAVWVSDRSVTLRDGTTKPLCDLLGPGSHGTTFGGEPLACASASAVLDVIEQENLLANARDLGAYAKLAIEKIQSPLIREVRGLGLMLAYELVPDFAERVAAVPGGRAPSLFMCDRLHAAGLLNIPSGTHSLRWLPPLNVTRAQIDEAASLLGAVLAAL